MWHFYHNKLTDGLVLVLIAANRITNAPPGMKGVLGRPGHTGHDGTYGMKGGKLIVLH